MLQCLKERYSLGHPVDFQYLFTYYVDLSNRDNELNKDIVLEHKIKDVFLEKRFNCESNMYALNLGSLEIKGQRPISQQSP